MTTLVLSGAATLAHAQTKPRVSLSNTAANESFVLDQSQTRRVLEFDQPARWGWKLEVQQPVTREMRLKDMEAGAYFKFTPSFRVGGAVGLADKEPAAKLREEQVTPRVRLETTLKF